MLLLIPAVNHLVSDFNGIQIHLMLLLILEPGRQPDTTGIQIHLMLLLILPTISILLWLRHSNTSHVTINLGQAIAVNVCLGFKYISCYY